MLTIANFIEKMYRQQQCTTPIARKYRNYALCSKYANIIEFSLKALITAYTVIGVLYALYPFVLFAVTREKIVPLRMYFPGIDEQSTIGFGFLITFNAAFVFCALTAVMPIDALTVIIFVNMPMVSSIIIRQLDEFRDRLRGGSIAAHEIRGDFLGMVAMHRTYNE